MLNIEAVWSGLVSDNTSRENAMGGRKKNEQSKFFDWEMENLGNGQCDHQSYILCCAGVFIRPLSIS